MGALSKASKTFCCFALLYFLSQPLCVPKAGLELKYPRVTSYPVLSCLGLASVSCCVTSGPVCPYSSLTSRLFAFCVLFHFTPYQPRDIFSGLVFGSLKMQEIYKSLAGLSCSLSELGHTPIPESLPMGQEMN